MGGGRKFGYERSGNIRDCYRAAQLSHRCIFTLVSERASERARAPARVAEYSGDTENKRGARPKIYSIFL